MSKTPNYDKKIQEILAATKPGERTCALTGEKWNMTEEEIGWYKKFNVPPSKRAPLTRLKQLAGYFTWFQWWYHKHPETGKPVLSGLNPNSGIRALPDKEWFAADFSRESYAHDPQKSFFEQFRPLQLATPVNAARNLIEPENSIALTSLGDVNSYLVMASSMKNGFLSLNADHCEDSGLLAYCNAVTGCYDVLRSSRLHNCVHARHSTDCLDCSFIFDCRNCDFCFGAVNKRNKKYLWFNEQLTETEWRKRRASVDLSRRSAFEEYRSRFEKLLREKGVWPENFNENVDNSTGEYVWGVTDAKEAYHSYGHARDLFYCFVCFTNVERLAFSGGSISCSDMIGSVVNSRSSNCRYCYAMVACQNMEYSMNCHNCENCFGCVGLQNKKFHIFNAPYVEEEYWKRVDELKCAMLERGEYGESFPVGFSASYFYESGAVMLFGSGKEDAERLGVAEYDPNANGASGYAEVAPDAKRTVDVPDAIDDMPVDQWAGVPIFDAEKNRQYSYLKSELEFYHKKRIAAPNKHFITRMYGLTKQMNSAIFVPETCAKCSKAIRVGKCFGYPERTIYCRPCYLKYLEEQN